MSLLILVCCVFLISSASAADVNVNGTTFTNISDTIAASHDGDVIYLNNGTYLSEGQQIEISKNNLTIIGGNLVNGTWDGTYTTLDAEYLSRIFHITGENCTIIGINFMNGNSTRGSAIYAEQTGSLYITECTFVGNIISNPLKEAEAYGGAILSKADTTVISTSKFISNSNKDSKGGNGGALYLAKSNNNKVDNCLFENNYAEKNGGAIYVRGANNTISGCEFINNSANYGGAIYCANLIGDNTEVKLISNKFINNNVEEKLHGANIVNDNIAIIEGNDFNNETKFIKNSGKITLITNTNIGNSVICGNGKITSETIIVINNGETTIVEENTTVTLKAVVTADGFLVKDGKLTFIAGNETLKTKTPVIEVTDGVYKATYIATESLTVNATFDKSTNLTVITTRILVGEIELHTEDLEKMVGSSDQFIANVTVGTDPVAGKNVTFIINNETFNKTTDENGTARLDIDLGVGTYSITTICENITTNNTITVTNHIQTEDIVKVYKNNTQFEVLVRDDDFEPVENATVDITISGKTYTKVTDKNGIATLNINLLPGEYTVTTSYNGEVETNKVTVVWGKLLTEDMNKYFKTADPFVATVTDFNDNPTPGVEVTFTINGKTYTKTTDENGEAKLNINLNPGNYKITTKYGNQSATNNVTVLSADIKTSDLEKYYKDPSQFIATIIDGNNPVAGVNVDFTINGKTYTKTTDENGEAKLNINLNPGKYTIVTTYADKTATNSITVLSGKIVTEDLVKYYKNASQFEAKIVDGNNNPIVGINVEFTINGKTYTRTTDENGQATLNINLGPGKYIIKTTCGPSEVLNNITVLSADIKTSDLTKYDKNDSQFTATIIGGNNPVAGVNVDFTINGKTYTRTTDENGQATLNINLQPGKYTIVTKHADKTAINNITVLPVVIWNKTKVTYKEGESVIATFLDGQGNRLINSSVCFIAGGKTYSRTTDENGTASLTINWIPGTYTIEAGYNGITESTKITVEKRTPKINVESTTVKQNEKLHVTVTDDKTKEPVSNIIVYYVVYYDESEDPIVAAQYTDANGCSQVTIGLPLGDYSIMILIQDDPYYSNIMLQTILHVI